MLWPKKNSYKEFDNEKNSCGSKIPLPPITFLMVRPLTCMFCVAYSDHVMFTREFAFCLIINYAYSTCITRHLKKKKRFLGYHHVA